MTPLLVVLVGAGLMFWLSGGSRAFRRLSAADLRPLLGAGIGLAALIVGGLLLASGRGLVALSTLVLVGPLAWRAWRRLAPAMAEPQAPASSAAMTRDEAYAVLGLRPGAAADEVRAAHRRLMRAAHPDAGGSDWVASRVNRARDILLAA